MSEEEVDFPHYFSIGIMHIFIIWVPLIGRSVGEYRQAIQQPNCHWQKEDADTQRQAMGSILRATFETIGVWLLILIGFAILIPLLTNPLDERMGYMVEAFSRLIAGLILGVLSIRVATWLDVYCKIREPILPEKLGTTIKELKFRVGCAVSNKILRFFWYMLLLFQGAGPAKIPVSIVAGLAVGFFIDWLIYKMRRLKSDKKRKWGCIAMVLILMGLAIGELGACVYYVSEVWAETCEGHWSAPNVAYAILVPLFPLIHGAYWYVGRKYKDEQRRRALPKQRMVYSMFISERRIMSPRAATKADGDGPEQSTLQALQELEEADDDEKAIDSGSVLDKTEQEIGSSGNSTPPQPEESPIPSPTLLKPIVGCHGDEDASGDILKSSLQPPSLNKSDDKDDDDNHDAEQRAQDENVATAPKKSVSIAPPVIQEEQPEEVETDDSNEEGNKAVPTYWELINDWQCCGCARGDDKTTFEKAWSVLVWTFYVVVTLFCIFSVISNIGATQEQEACRVKLPEVNEILYENIDEGPVCAFDNRTADYSIPAREWTPNPITFDDKDAAHSAGYSILHCGPCGACSDWLNLELEYTTR